MTMTTTVIRWHLLTYVHYYLLVVSVVLHSLFEKIFCARATSAPVERVSHSGLFMRPHRARMGDQMLSDLVFLKCNKHV